MALRRVLVCAAAVLLVGGCATETTKDTASPASLPQKWDLRTSSPAWAPAPRPESTGTTSSVPMPYPERVTAIYHMLWNNGTTPRLSDIPPEVNVVNLAFAQGDPLRLVGYGAQSEAEYVADARALRARGVRIVASIGGAKGHTNVSNREGVIDGLMAINATLPLDGIDWDIEQGDISHDDIVAISLRMKQLRGPDFAITLAPNGSNLYEYLPIARTLHQAGALSMYGQQFYDAPVSVDAAKRRIAEAIAFGIPESKIGVGMMIADGPRHWTVEQSEANTEALKREFPDLRGGYLWEAGRAGTQDWAERVGPRLLDEVKEPA